MPLPGVHTLNTIDLTTYTPSCGTAPVVAYIRVPFRCRLLKATGILGGAITTANGTITVSVNSTALAQAKLTVVPGEPGGTQALSVVGSVALDRPQNGQQRIVITWALVERNGKQLGVVKQENAVPQGSLDGRWGDVANLVAAAAAPGILAIIEKAEQVRSGT